MIKLERYNCRHVSSVVTHLAIDAGGLGFDSRVGQIGAVSPTIRHHSDVSSELRCLGAKWWR